MESELEAAYSEFIAYANIGVALVHFGWAGWQMYQSFASKFYFFETGNYAGRCLANLGVFIHWMIEFDRLLAQRRVQFAVMQQGTERPRSMDTKVIIIRDEPLRPEDDIFEDDQIWR